MSTSTPNHLTLGKRTRQEISPHLPRGLARAVTTPQVATSNSKRPRHGIPYKALSPQKKPKQIRRQSNKQRQCRCKQRYTRKAALEVHQLSCITHLLHQQQKDDQVREWFAAHPTQDHKFRKPIKYLEPGTSTFLDPGHHNLQTITNPTKASELDTTNTFQQEAYPTMELASITTNNRFLVPEDTCHDTFFLDSVQLLNEDSMAMPPSQQVQLGGGNPNIQLQVEPIPALTKPALSEIKGLSSMMPTVTKLRQQLHEMRKSAKTWQNNLAPLNAISKCLELERYIGMRLLQEANERLHDVQKAAIHVDRKPDDGHRCYPTSATRINPQYDYKQCSARCARDELSQLQEGFARMDISSAQSRLWKVEHMLDRVNGHPDNNDWEPSDKSFFTLYALNKKVEEAIRVFNLEPVEPIKVDFEHIPSLIRTRYEQTWRDEEFKRDFKDKERELTILEAVHTNNHMINLLRMEIYIPSQLIGQKVITLDDLDEDKDNLINKLAKLIPSQLDVNVAFSPVDSLMDTLNLEHRELLNKHDPVRMQDLINNELGECYRIYADGLALTPPEDTTTTELTISMSDFTYREELLDVLSKVHQCRYQMTLILDLLGKIVMPIKLAQLYRVVIERIRRMLTQRLDAAVDHILLPSLPGENTRYRVTIELTEEQKALEIPPRLLSFILKRSSEDKRNLHALPKARCRELLYICKDIRVFSARMLKSISVYGSILGKAGNDRMQAVQDITVQFTIELNKVFDAKEQCHRQGTALEIKHASVLHKQTVLERSLKEGSHPLIEYLEHLHLLLAASAVTIMSTSEAMVLYPHNATLAVSQGHIRLMSLPKVSVVLNTTAIATRMLERQVVALQMGKEILILQLPIPVPPANRRNQKSNLKQLLNEQHLASTKSI